MADDTIEEIAAVAREASLRSTEALNIAQAASSTAAAASSAADQIKRAYTEDDRVASERRTEAMRRLNEAYSASMQALGSVNKLSETVAAVDRKTDEILKTEGARSARVAMLLIMQLAQLLTVVAMSAWWVANDVTTVIN